MDKKSVEVLVRLLQTLPKIVEDTEFYVDTEDAWFGGDIQEFSEEKFYELFDVQKRLDLPDYYRYHFLVTLDKNNKEYFRIFRTYQRTSYHNKKQWRFIPIIGIKIV